MRSDLWLRARLERRPFGASQTLQLDALYAIVV
jgi:hypothetical protein